MFEFQPNTLILFSIFIQHFLIFFGHFSRGFLCFCAKLGHFIINEFSLYATNMQA